MRTFKKLIGFVLFNALVCWMMTFALAQPSSVKILLKEAKKERYDTLFLGQSHGESSWNPFVFSESLGCEAFNLNRRLFPLDDIYYIMMEANQNKNYKRIILDLDPSYWEGIYTGSCGSDTNLLFRLSGGRSLSYLVNVLWNQRWNIALFDYFFEIPTIRSSPGNVRSKMSIPYLKGDEAAIQIVYDQLGVSKCYYYLGRGFRYGVRKSGVDWPTWDFDSSSIDDGKVEAFSKIVQYCKKNKIQLICVQSALPPTRLINENMEEVHTYFTELCNSFEVPFFDMNYVRDLERTDDDYVDIDGHMMGSLADAHTELLCRILSEEEYDSFFYRSYDEVLEALGEDV